MPPTSANGKICYLEIPATDPARSAAFYSQVFGWTMRTRGDGAQSFDDTTGQVSGAFVRGRRTWDAPGLLFYIMVDSVAAACEAVVAHGGTIVQEIGADAPEITARFSDPAGNIIGLYQEPGRAAQVRSGPAWARRTGSLDGTWPCCHSFRHSPSARFFPRGARAPLRRRPPTRRRPRRPGTGCSITMTPQDSRRSTRAMLCRCRTTPRP